MFERIFRKNICVSACGHQRAVRGPDEGPRPELLHRADVTEPVSKLSSILIIWSCLLNEDEVNQNIIKYPLACLLPNFLNYLIPEREKVDLSTFCILSGSAQQQWPDIENTLEQQYRRLCNQHGNVIIIFYELSAAVLFRSRPLQCFPLHLFDGRLGGLPKVLPNLQKLQTVRCGSPYFPQCLDGKT